MNRKRRTRTQSIPDNLLGRRYAESLRERATLLRTDFLITRKARDQIAEDLEALAKIAEGSPATFKRLK